MAPDTAKTSLATDPVLSRLAEWLRNAKAAFGRDELSDSDTSELQRIARDSGMSATELVRLMRQGPHAADLLPKMMRALGLDPAKTGHDEPKVMHDLQRLCSQCGHKRQCVHDLAAGQAEQHYHEYCLNCVTLDALKAQDERS